MYIKTSTEKGAPRRVKEHPGNFPRKLLAGGVRQYIYYQDEGGSDKFPARLPP